MQQMRFQHTWRSYQERVLGELDVHLDDTHLHVVAAPGSGKTILGLEVMRRLGKPSLILAPTLAIRNQWVDRLKSMFLSEGASTDWISFDLRNPKTVTVVTYQALHMAMTGKKTTDDLNADNDDELVLGVDSAESESKGRVDVLALLNENRVDTLILDEAHHLRTEWWKALTKLKTGLGMPTVVSLTATPPYDVEPTEWERYQELCGPIDAEISVPELVERGDLCPHQDIVYFSSLTAEEKQELRQFNRDIEEFIKVVVTDARFADAIENHPWIANPMANEEEILGDPEFFSAMIMYINSAGMKPSRQVLALLGVGRRRIPPLGAEAFESLLVGYIYKYADTFQDQTERQEQFKRHLDRIGALERRQITLVESKTVKKLLAASLGKLTSIEHITRLESSALGDVLRMVILTDFIRKTELPKGPDDVRDIAKMGVIPIFETLRRAGIGGIRLGVLSGSFVVIPAESQALLIAKAGDNGIAPDDIRLGPLPHDERFLTVAMSGKNKHQLVHVMTQVFGAGGISVLVGTQALLGEGWDAPQLNTLVLASYVGSFMLSNQMRGRAIRIDPENPDKAANIWHLAAVDLEKAKLLRALAGMHPGATSADVITDPFDPFTIDLGADVALMKRRFRAFEGVSFTEPLTIESGFSRMGIPRIDPTRWKERSIHKITDGMITQSQNRADLTRQWQEALHTGNPKPEMEPFVETDRGPGAFTLGATIWGLLLQAVWVLLFYFHSAVTTLGSQAGIKLQYLLYGAGLALLFMLPKTLKALWLFLRNGSMAGNVQQAGRTILKTLLHMGVIETGPANLKVEAVRRQGGRVHCRLQGGTSYEKTCFLEALEELLSPINNPRYVLIRRSNWLGIKRTDYHAVPKSIGQKKEHAEFFARRWNRYVGPCEVVYTRTGEGRKLLLKARSRALSSKLVKRARRTSVWH